MLCQVTVTAAEDSLSALVEPNVSRTSERFEAIAKNVRKRLGYGDCDDPAAALYRGYRGKRAGYRPQGKGVRRTVGVPHVRADNAQRSEGVFYKKLEENFPGSGLAERYAKTYGERYVCNSPRIKRLWKVFTEECKKLGLVYEMRDIIASYKLGYGDSQLFVFLNILLEELS